MSDELMIAVPVRTIVPLVAKLIIEMPECRIEPSPMKEALLISLRDNRSGTSMEVALSYDDLDMLLDVTGLRMWWVYLGKEPFWLKS